MTYTHAMVSVIATIEDSSLVIEPKGIWSKLASLMRKVTIPLRAITSVSTASAKIKGWKLAGTDFSPHIAGLFYDFRDGRIFYTQSNTDKCVTLKLHGFKYSEVVVQVEDKEKIAEMIRKALRR
jgi:hypothetical protein